MFDGSKQIGQYFQKLINYTKEIKVSKEEEDTCKTIILVFIIVVVYGLLIKFFFSQLSPDDEKICQKKFAADMELTNVRVMKIQTYDLPASKITRKPENKWMIEPMISSINSDRKLAQIDILLLCHLLYFVHTHILSKNQTVLFLFHVMILSSSFDFFYQAILILIALVVFILLQCNYFFQKSWLRLH